MRISHELKIFIQLRLRMIYSGELEYSFKFDKLSQNANPHWFHIIHIQTIFTCSYHDQFSPESNFIWLECNSMEYICSSNIVVLWSIFKLRALDRIIILIIPKSFSGEYRTSISSHVMNPKEKTKTTIVFCPSIYFPIFKFAPTEVEISSKQNYCSVIWTRRTKKLHSKQQSIYYLLILFCAFPHVWWNVK